MEEYSLDRHLKSYCDAHEEYQNLYATWSLNRKSCSEMLKTVLLRYPHYSLHDASHAEAILSKIEMLLQLCQLLHRDVHRAASFLSETRSRTMENRMAATTT